MAIVKVDGKELEFAANAATPIRYKQIFKSDLMKEFEDPEKMEYYSVVTQLAYVMNRQATKKGFSNASFEDFVNWLSGFSPLAFTDAVEEILAVYTGSEETTSEPKK